MKACIFPAGKILFDHKPFSREVFEITLEEIYKARDKFTGYIQFEKADTSQFFLFFLKGAVYAAGESIDCNHEDILIRDLFHRISAGTETPLTLSLNETDPVLLKEMLIVLQREPTTQTVTNLIDLEEISEKIRSDAADALIVLKKHDWYNFFFYKDGKGVMSHCADRDFEREVNEANMPVSEQVFLYAYPSDLTPVEALIYRNISTAPSADSGSLSYEELITLLYDIEDTESFGTARVVVKGSTKHTVSLVIVQGPHTGSTLSAQIPCVIGRKQADIHIKDRHVSRRHAHIIELEDKFFIEDLDSTNGTFINGKEIKVCELSQGDTITLGETRLKVEAIESS
jgi:hypothetical protein